MRANAILVALLSAVLGCATASAAERKWYPSERISGPGNVNAQAMMDREGAALVLFAPTREPFDLVRATARPAGGEFSDPVVVDWLKTEAVGFAVAATFDSAGRALLIWPTSRAAGQRVHYSTHHPETKHWITREFFPDVDIALPVLARPDGKGTILAAWSQPPANSSQNCCEGPFVARMRHGSPFGKPSRVGDRSSQHFALDASRSGAAAIAWSDFQGFRAVVQPAGGEFGSTETVPGASVALGGQIPQLAIDDAGEVLFAMKSEEGTGSMQEPDTRVVVVVRRPNGEYLEPQTLSASNRTGSPRIAAGPAGESVVSWAEGPGEDASLRVSVRGPDGNFSPPETLVAGGVSRGDDPQIGMDDAGNAIAVWAASRDGEWTVYAAHRPPHGSFGRPQAISKAFADRYPGPRLTVGGPGNALVTWHRFPGDVFSGEIHAAVFDVDRPSVPEFGVEPERLAFRWTVSEASRTTITLRRGAQTRRTIKTRGVAGENRKRIRRGSLPAGRYTAVLRATDGLGHRSKRRYARFRLVDK